jgi:hypothetical protein
MRAVFGAVPCNRFHENEMRPEEDGGTVNPKAAEAVELQEKDCGSPECCIITGTTPSPTPLAIIACVHENRMQRNSRRARNEEVAAFIVLLLLSIIIIIIPTPSLQPLNTAIDRSEMYGTVPDQAYRGGSADLVLIRPAT